MQHDVNKQKLEDIKLLP